MIELVISGGQSGADQAGWNAAQKAGIPTAGWMPLGFRTEYGVRPEFAVKYGAKQHPVSGYPARTEANVRDAEVTLWFGRGDSSGFYCTRNAANKHHMPFWEIGSDPAELTGKRLLLLEYTVINVAGNRESSSPGIRARVESYLAEVFRFTNP